jgi:hypothetical protein
MRRDRMKRDTLARISLERGFGGVAPIVIGLLAALAAGAGCDVGERARLPSLGDGGAGSGGASGAGGAGGGAIVDVGLGPWPPSMASPAPAPLDDVTVFAFSQVGTGTSDSQVVQLAPDMSLRSWQRWDTGGVTPGEYDFSYVTACHAAGVRFLGGTTATALFADELPAAEFQAVVTRDASGAIVSHDNNVPGMRRGSLADPDYRAYLMNIAKIQIDGGVDGLFFDEINGDYQGATYDGNEGFDTHHLADFNGYLLWKYPGADYATKFEMTPDNLLRPGVPEGDLTHSFDYLAYLASHGWTATPFASQNPLAVEWGRTVPNRPAPSPGTFVDTAEPYRYWQAMATELRAYAQQKYGKAIYLTSNGIWPFVDLQSVGLYEGNQDDDGGAEAEYVPVQSDGSLDGTRSLQRPFLNLEARSAALAPGAPVVLFIDWPTQFMSRYLAFTQQEQEDYWRLYAAEAYANGLFFAFFLLDTVGDPSATTLGLMPFFTGLTAFYRAHAGLYHGVTRSTAAVTTSLPTAMVVVADQAQPHRRLVHLVNHEYQSGIVPQSNVTVSIPSSAAPAGVTLASPDATGDMVLPFGYSGGVVTVTVPSLDAYGVVVVAY